MRDNINYITMISEKQGTPKYQPASTDDSSASNAEKLFGVQLQDLNQELSDALGYIRGRGVLITAVEPDSPADEAGLERGLVIYRAGTSETNSVKQIEELLRVCRAARNSNSRLA